MPHQSESSSKESWSSHIEQWSQSGLSQREYCQQAGINNKRFYYHFHRLKQKASEPKLSFIETKAVKSVLIKSEVPRVRVRLILPNGVQAIVEDAELSLLSELFNAAGGLSC